QGQLVRAQPAHGVARENSAVGGEAVGGGQAVPHLPEVELGLVVVPPVGAPAHGGGADGVAGLARGLDEVGVEGAVLVVLDTERVQGPRPRRRVGGVVPGGRVGGGGVGRGGEIWA